MSEKIPGVSYHSQSGRWRSYITVDGKRKYLGYFATQAQAAEERALAEQENPKPIKVRAQPKGSAPQAMGPDRALLERILSPIAFRELADWADKQEGDAKGVIDTSPGSEFDIWCQAADICEVDLKPASEFFSWLNEVVFDAPTAQDAMKTPAIFVSALRQVGLAKVSLAHLNSVLQVAAMQRRRMTLEKMLKVAQQVPDFV